MSSRFARIIAIRQHDHIFSHLVREIERAHTLRRKCCPCSVIGRLHGREASFDAFADHQYLAGMTETYRSATTRAEHHLLRIDRRFPFAITAKEGSVNSGWRSFRAIHHQRHHRWPHAARGMLQPDVESEARWRRNFHTTRPKIVCETSVSSAGRDARQTPSAACLRLTAPTSTSVRVRRSRRRPLLWGPAACHKPRARTASITSRWSHPA